MVEEETQTEEEEPEKSLGGFVGDEPD